jgi:NADPH:quinone reductase-like Zn-dependent oxidoreductase
VTAAQRALLVDPAASGRLVLGEAPLPRPAPHEALVRVRCFSLNRGELRRAWQLDRKAPIGWDFAGVVEAPAADGSGPPRDARVVGLLGDGAWAERVASPTRALAAIPDAVSDAHASTLPVAGLTALLALRRGGAILGRRVLVTGASGGVGEFALGLARHGGARVVAQVRREEQAARAREAGAHDVAVGGDERALAPLSPYDFVLESVGGETLAAAMALLAPRGECVAFGISGSPQATIDVRRFYATGGVTLRGFLLFHELEREPAGKGLAVLLDLVVRGVLAPRVTTEAPWREVARVARDLYDRRLEGKVVLHVR